MPLQRNAWPLWLWLAVAGPLCPSCSHQRDRLGPVESQWGPARLQQAAVDLRDAAVELAGELPQGADHCVAARPASMPTELRGRYRLISHAEPLAWLRQATVLAYATAQRTRSGRSARVTLMKVAGSKRQVRRVLHKHSGLNLVWNAQTSSCLPDACPTVVEFVDIHRSASGFRDRRQEGIATWLLRLQSGSWPGAGVPAGVERRCLRLAAASPEAVEVSARRRTGPWAGANGQLPLSTTAVTFFDGNGVDIERFDLMPDLASAEQLAGQEPNWAFPAGPLGVPHQRTSRRQADLTVRTATHISWEDLGLVSDDLERHRAAAEHASVLARLRPERDLDMADVDTTAEQVQLRLSLLQHAEGGTREAVVLELCAVLRSALSLHPQDSRLLEAAQRLCDVAGTACETKAVSCTPRPRAN